MPTGYYDTHAFNASLAIYSPVTLSNEWPQLERLLFMIICAGTSSTANGFFVAAFCVEHTLRRIGEYTMQPSVINFSVSFITHWYSLK